MDRYISIKVILDDILDHPLLKDVTFERAVDYTIRFMRKVGCPRMFIEKTDLIPIENYRGQLPCDFNEVIQVRTAPECGGSYGPFRHTTDSFHMSDYKQNSFDLTYKIQGGVIFTSMESGTIEIAYNAIGLDSDGYPLIPDNESFREALELFIKKKHFTKLFDEGKITPAVYNNVLQQYAWAVGQAQSDLIRPTIDQMQSITNSLNTLIPRVNEHSSGFVNNGTMERIKAH